MEQIRQGDVLLVRVNALPEGIQEQPRKDGLIVLAYGEVTGHAHAIAEPDVKWFGAANGQKYLESARPFTLKHGELSALIHAREASVEVAGSDHTAQRFAPGVWMVVRQYEFSAEQLRQVMD